MSRLRPTLIDYVLVAINPALIMVLIGSLVFFVLELFYQGEYPERLHYCLASYVFGMVLVARISMEEGWEHAAPFGAALFVVVALAMHRFVSYEGSPLAPLGWIINYTLMGLTWWCAHQLTWDCTLVDESQDASGEGLLQTVGLGSGRAGGEEAPVKPTVRSATSGKTADFDPGSAAPVERPPRQSWWERFLERRRRPHAPGVWVVYFSLAALPIFGIGQAFIPVANTSSRRYAFLLLCLYVAAALGLLLTTSFLGLRRYLRQRRLEMPVSMVGAWLTTGTVLILVLLVLTAMLPRPAAEYSISALPLQMTSAHREASRVSVGKEGSKNEKPKSGSSSSQDAKTTGDQTDSKLKNSGQPAGKSSDEGTAAGKTKDGRSSSGKSDKAQADKSAAANDQAQQAGKTTEQSKDSQSKESSSSQSSTPPAESTQVEPPAPTFVSPSAMALAKWIFYGAVILVALWWSWRHREELLAWLAQMWRDFWALFSGRRRERSAAAAAPIQHRSFLDFSDPFAAGTFGRYSPQELVRYTFEAFEAWARDNGSPREADQTAYEFARQVGERSARLAAPARTLAELYSRAAYSPASLPEATVEQLRTFWQTLQAEAYSQPAFPVISAAP